MRVRTLALVIVSAFVVLLGSTIVFDTQPASASPLTGMAAVSAGGTHTCGLTTGGGVKCWGDHGLGQLGVGMNSGLQTCVFIGSAYPCSATPLDVSGLTSGVAAVAAGMFHTCALTTGGGVKCWGWNTYGQLGIGTTNGPETCGTGDDAVPCSTTPVDVMGLTSGVLSITTGGSHTCAVLAGGAVKCWGYNAFGELGNGTAGPDTCTIAGTDFACSTAPVDVSGLTDGIAAVTTGDHTCALTTGGAVKCWGHNDNGQLGIGTTAGPETCDFYGDSYACSTTPVAVIGLPANVSALTAGGGHTCAITPAAGLKCWGWNGGGQLGDGGACGESCATPVDVSGLTSGVLAVEAGGIEPIGGGGQTCAIVTGGGVKCWGINTNGQLGSGSISGPQTCMIDGAPLACSRVPMNAMGLTSGATGVSAGQFHTCALMAAGGVRCWGNNSSGQLGDGTTTNRFAPVAVQATALYPAGDVNCNNRANSVDGSLILQLDARLIFFLPCIQNGDANRNGTINVIDAALVLQYDAGLLDELPVGNG